jgi:nucleotide-binding universal stress UspA family protein
VYTRIVVGTDGSDTAAAAVRHAFALARSSGAQLHLVTAWTRLPALILAGAAAPTVTPAPDDGAWVGDLHRELADQAASYGVTTEAHAVEGGAAHALLDVAAAVEADLIVVGNRGMTGLRGKLGSVPNSVAHKAPCAVLVVPTT